MKNNLIGIKSTKKECPYCHKKLEKILKRKTTCKLCGKSIFVRTRPSDMEKVVIKEGEIEKIEESWIKCAINSKWFKKIIEMGATEKDFRSMYNILKDRFKMAPSISDVIWGVFNNIHLKLIQENNQKDIDELKKLMSNFKKKESIDGGKELWST